MVTVPNHLIPYIVGSGSFPTRDGSSKSGCRCSRCTRSDGILQGSILRRSPTHKGLILSVVGQGVCSGCGRCCICLCDSHRYACRSHILIAIIPLYQIPYIIGPSVFPCGNSYIKGILRGSCGIVISDGILDGSVICASACHQLLCRSVIGKGLCLGCGHRRRILDHQSDGHTCRLGGGSNGVIHRCRCGVLSRPHRHLRRIGSCHSGSCSALRISGISSAHIFNVLRGYIQTGCLIECRQLGAA